MHETDHLDGKLYVDEMYREIFSDEEEDVPDESADGEEEGSEA